MQYTRGGAGSKFNYSRDRRVFAHYSNSFFLELISALALHSLYRKSFSAGIIFALDYIILTADPWKLHLFLFTLLFDLKTSGSKLMSADTLHHGLSKNCSSELSRLGTPRLLFISRAPGHWVGPGTRNESEKSPIRVPFEGSGRGEPQSPLRVRPGVFVKKSPKTQLRTLFGLRGALFGELWWLQLNRSCTLLDSFRSFFGCSKGPGALCATGHGGGWGPRI